MYLSCPPQTCITKEGILPWKLAVTASKCSWLRLRFFLCFAMLLMLVSHACNYNITPSPTHPLPYPRSLNPLSFKNSPKLHSLASVSHCVALCSLVPLYCVCLSPTYEWDLQYSAAWMELKDFMLTESVRRTGADTEMISELIFKETALPIVNITSAGFISLLTP